MTANTKLISPATYADLLMPNCIDFNNSFAEKSRIGNDVDVKYKRGTSMRNQLCLTKAVAVAYDCADYMHRAVVASSGTALAAAISLSGKFNQILYAKRTYPEMISAFALKTPATELMHIEQIVPGSLVCIESFTVPECIDNARMICDLCSAAHEVGALVLVDNSCSTALNVNPFDFGADFCLESLSKLACGFNTSLLGFLAVRDESYAKCIFSSIKDVIRVAGFYPTPIDCYLGMLGLQTLKLRLQKIADSTAHISNFLTESGIAHRCIPESGLLFVQMSVNFKQSELARLSLFQNADTFGVNFSVVTLWKDLQILRFSIGLEDVQDLLDDLSSFFDFETRSLVELIKS